VIKKFFSSFFAYFVDEQIFNIVNSQKVDQNEDGFKIISEEAIEMTEDDYIIEEDTGTDEQNVHK